MKIYKLPRALLLAAVLMPVVACGAYNQYYGVGADITGSDPMKMVVLDPVGTPGYNANGVVRFNSVPGVFELWGFRNDYSVSQAAPSGVVNADLNGNTLSLGAAGLSTNYGSDFVISGGTIVASLPNLNIKTVGPGGGVATMTINSIIGDVTGVNNFYVRFEGVRSVVELTADNYYTNYTEVVSGATLKIARMANLGVGGNVWLDGGTLNYVGTGDVFNRALDGAGGILQLNGSGDFIIVNDDKSSNFSGTIQLNSGNLVFGDGVAWGLLGTGAIVNNGRSVVANSGVNGFIDNAISGAGDFIKNGSAVTSLRGMNTYTGATTVNAGTLVLANGNAIADTGVITLNGAGVLRVDGAETIKSMSGSSGSSIILRAVLTLADQATSTYAGVISGTSGLTKAGSGLWTLTGTNTYNGVTTISGGELRLGSGGTTGEIGGGALVNNAMLTVNRSNNVTMVNVISGAGALNKLGAGTLILTGNNTYTGTTTVSTGALQLGAGATVGNLATGAIVLNGVAGLSVNRTNPLTLANVISGTGTFLQFGSGTTTLSGANTYTGLTTVAAGTLALAGGAAIADTGAVTIRTGATLQLNAAETIGDLSAQTGSVVKLQSYGLTTNITNDMTVYASIQGTGSLTKNGARTLALFGENTYTGVTTINDGDLSANGGRAIADTGAVVLTGGRFLINDSETIGALSGTGIVYLDSAGLTIAGTATTEFAGQIQGASVASTFTKSGTGLLTLSGESYYLGDTTVSEGTLIITGGTRSSVVNIASGATLVVSGTRAIDDRAAVISSGSGRFIVKNGETIGSLAGTGFVEIQVSSSLRIDGASSTTYSGVISGDGLFYKQGTGTLTLSGVNTVGQLAVYDGTLVLEGGNTIADTAIVSVYDTGSGAATLRLAASERIGSLFGNLGANVDLDSHTLSLGDSGSYVYAGKIIGTGGLTKYGAGTQTFSGASTYSGATQVVEGALNLTGTFGNTAMTVSSGATLTGTGATAGAVTIEEGGILTAVAGEKFTMGSLTLADTSRINVTLGVPSTDGVFQVNGDLTLDGELYVTNDGGFSKGVYRLIDYTGTLTDRGLKILMITGGISAANVAVQTTEANQVNLISDVGGQFVFWDGVNTTGSGIRGGDGIWTATSENWTVDTGLTNGAFASDGFAVFQATAGVVTVSNAVGAVRASGMQFAVTGYELTGEPLTLVNDSVDGFATIRVGDGPVRRTAISATISAVLEDNGAFKTHVVKTDLGTLILTADNTYTGTTTIAAGTLQLGSGATGGTTGSLASEAIINNGTFIVNRSNATTLAQNISGTGGFTKLGAGITTLSGTNTYTGKTSVTAGTLVLAGGGAIVDTGAVELGSGATLQLNSAETIGSLIGAAGSSVDLQTNRLTVGDATATTFAGVIRGTGGLTKLGAGTLILSGANDYSGATTLSQGTLQIGNGGATGSLGSGAFVNNAALIVNRTGTIALANSISGTGTLTKTGSGTLTLSGSNTYAGLTTVNGGVLVLSGGGAIADNASIQLAAGTLRLAGTETIGSLSGISGTQVDLQSYGLTTNGQGDTTFAGAIIGAGTLAKNGGGTMTLSGANTYTGPTTVTRGVLVLSGGAALSDSARVVMNGGLLRLGTSETIGTLSGSSAVELQAYTLTLAGAGATTYSGVISGTGSFNKTGAGTLTLSGASTYTGATQLSAGTLALTGSLKSSSLTVATGATLTGSGLTTGSVTIANGATLTHTAGRQLTTGNLVLSSTSQVNVILGAASLDGPFRVNGNLTLDGVLSVASAGGFGQGVYRIFDYSGALTNNGLVLGTLPSGVSPLNIEIQALAGSHEVNLVSNAQGQSAFWDGTNTTPDGTVHGGTGTWNTTASNWTRANGMANGPFITTPQAGFAIFQSTAGVVTISNAAGNVAASGMQFATTGYSMTGDALTLVNDATTGVATIRVGEGPMRVTPIVATIGVVLRDSGATPTHLVKTDTGTLVLTGASTYTGSTTIESGTLALGNGSLTGSLTTSALVNNGTLLVNRSNAVALTQVISGTGVFSQAGTGITTLSAANTYTGQTTVTAGTLALAGGFAVADTGAVQVGAGATLRLDAAERIGSLSGVTGATVNLQSYGLTVGDTANTIYAGAITGTGALTKTGSGQLTLSGSSTYTGATQVSAGTLILTGSLTSQIDVASGATLTGNGVTTGAVTIADGGILSKTTVQALTTGSLTLSSTSQVNIILGTAQSTGIFRVNGDLTLDGVLNITDGGNFGRGVYRLFDYTGALINDTLALGMVPAGVDVSTLTIQTAIDKEVNLLSGIDGQFVFWDGSNTGSTGAVLGGTGTWSVAGANWTNADASAHGLFVSTPQAGFAIFGGSSGVVTISNTPMPVKASGMQFMTSGYSLTGGALTLENDLDTGYATIRVGDGSGAATMFATLGVVIQDDGATPTNIRKTDSGTLIFTGENTYTGTTTVVGGTLQIGDGGVTGALGSGATSIGDGATLAYKRADAVLLDRVITGDGAFAQIGLGVLTVSGANTYTGGTRIATGSELVLSDTGTLGTGDVANAGTLGFGATSAKTFANTITGTGAVVIRGAGPITLTGTSTYTGATQVSAGSALVVTGELGATAVRVDGALSGSGTIGGTVDIAQGGRLVGTLGETLTTGTLTFRSSGSILDVTLPVTSSSTSFVVNGDVTLNGSVNITSAAVLDYGVYRLINYTGTLIDNGMVIDSVPVGQNRADFVIQTSVDNQVNIANLSGLGYNFWNGAGTGGGIVGGAGTWSAGATNWTSVSGGATGTQGSGYLIFQGGGSIVRVSDAAGVIGAAGREVTGMQFAADDYFLTGSPIQLTNDADLGYATIRVGDGLAGSAISATLDVALTGDADVRKTDFGTLVLTETAAYTGTTTVQAGVLRLGDGGTAGALAAGSAVTLASGGTLAVNRADVVRFANTLDGAGTLVQQGAGTLVLVTDSVRTGLTRVERGVLQIGDAATGGRSGSLGAGDVEVLGGATLAFDRIDATTVANRLAGAGRVDVFGGELTLTGANTHTGTTYVHGGATLRIASASSTADVVVDTNALFGGSGTVRGDLLNYGVVSPGFSPGTLVVAGDYTQAAGGVLWVEIDAAGAYDRVDVGGAAVLDGAIKLNLTGYVIDRSDTFTVLTAAGGVTGTLTLDAPIYVAAGLQLAVNPHDVTLSFAAAPAPGPIVAGLTPNQTAVGKGLVQLLNEGKAPDLIGVVVGLSSDQLVPALNALSPQSMDRWWANLRHNTVALVRSTEDRMDRFYEIPKHGLEFWTHANQRESHFRGNADEQKARGSASGVTVGADVKPFDDLQVGALFQYGYERIMTSARTDVDHYGAAAYARYDLPVEFKDVRVFVDGVAGFGYGDYDTKRAVNVPGYYRTAVSSTGAWDNFANVRLGVETDVHGVKFTPYVAAAYTRYSVSGYTERDAGDANLSISGVRAESLAMRLGFSIEAPLTLWGYTVSPTLNIAWRREYSDDGMNIGSNLAGAAYTVRGVGAKKDGLEAALAMNVTINARWSAYGSVGAYVDGDAGSSQNYRLGVSYRY